MLAFVPSDPGALGYAAAFETIRTQGEAALVASHDGHVLFRSFDFVECVNLTRWGKSSSSDAKWFRLLTCAAHFLARLQGERDIPLHYGLAALLVDGLGLGESLGAPTDSLADVCAELGGSIEEGHGDPLCLYSDLGFCTLGELLTTTRNESRLERMCDALDDLQARAHTFYLPGTIEPDPRFLPCEGQLWGLTPFDQLHPDWLALTEERFPTCTPRLSAMKETLLRDGARWARRKRTLC